MSLNGTTTVERSRQQTACLCAAMFLETFNHEQMPQESDHSNFIVIISICILILRLHHKGISALYGWPLWIESLWLSCQSIIRLCFTCPALAAFKHVSSQLNQHLMIPIDTLLKEAPWRWCRRCWPSACQETSVANSQLQPAHRWWRTSALPSSYVSLQLPIAVVHGADM